jgi:hypothetical protein
MIPTLIILALLTLSLGMNIATHGKERKPSNAGMSFIGFLLWLGLLYWAGLFDKFF